MIFGSFFHKKFSLRRLAFSTDPNFLGWIFDGGVGFEGVVMGYPSTWNTIIYKHVQIPTFPSFDGDQLRDMDARILILGSIHCYIKEN